MSTTTSKLGLFKYDIINDASEVFNITKALNNNWDALDIIVADKEDISKSIIDLGTSNGTFTLNDNLIYKITPNGTCIFTLPTNLNSTNFHQILIQINLSTVYTIDVGTSYYFNKTTPDLSESGVYNLIYEYDTNDGYWVCGLLTKGATS